MKIVVLYMSKWSWFQSFVACDLHNIKKNNKFCVGCSQNIVGYGSTCSLMFKSVELYLEKMLIVGIWTCIPSRWFHIATKPNMNRTECKPKSKNDIIPNWIWSLFFYVFQICLIFLSRQIGKWLQSPLVFSNSYLVRYLQWFHIVGFSLNLTQPPM